MKEYYLSEDVVDRVIALVGREDEQKFATSKEVSDIWLELGEGIIERMAKKEGWSDKEAEGRAHRKFLSSLAAHVGLGYQTMLNRQKIGDSVIARGYLGGANEDVSYSKWVCLHANAEKGEDGLILKEVLDKRLEWFHTTADKFGGQPPSVLDIQKEFRQNGKDAEWLVLWNQLVRTAKKLKKLDETPNLLRGALHEIEKVELD